MIALPILPAASVAIASTQASSVAGELTVPPFRPACLQPRWRPSNVVISWFVDLATCA
ncbi:MAG: hypothetical protein ABI080_18565 [Candidatus Binatia bacterium]